MSPSDGASVRSAASAGWSAHAQAGLIERPASAAQVAEEVLDLADDAIARRGRFAIVVAGGGTPRPIYERLRSADADWRSWVVVLGDERCLPVGHPERNDTMLREAWLDHVVIGSFVTAPTELGTRVAAQRLARDLAGLGRFDLCLLGLGEDGHTASLFHRAHLDAQGPTLAVDDAPKPPPERVTLTARRLGQTRRLAFLVGAGKEHALDQLRAGEPIPAAAIRAPCREVLHLAPPASSHP